MKIKENEVRSVKDELLNKYEEETHIYTAFEKRCRDLIEELIAESGFKYHIIESRIKTLESLKKKLESKMLEDYEVTDLLGIRIITYYEDIVDDITDILKKEFKVDTKNSIDKRNKEDKFGYSSVHLVLELSESRTELTENKKYLGLKFEVQIKSILQHAWAVVSHELNYKSEKSMPQDEFRKLIRQSSMLEEVDHNFKLIRELNKEYSQEIKVNIEQGKLDTPLNGISLFNYLSSSSLAKNELLSMAKSLNIEVKEMLPPIDMDLAVERLQIINVNTLKELEELLITNKMKISKFFKTWINLNNKQISFESLTGIPLDLIIYYLTLLMIVEEKNSDLYNEFSKLLYSNNQEDVKEFYRKLKRIEEIWSMENK